MSRCNYCLFQDLRRKGGDVTIEEKPVDRFFPKGVDVKVNGKWQVWFAELPDHCCCND